MTQPVAVPSAAGTSAASSNASPLVSGDTAVTAPGGFEQALAALLARGDKKGAAALLALLTKSAAPGAAPAADTAGTGKKADLAGEDGKTLPQPLPFALWLGGQEIQVPQQVLAALQGAASGSGKETSDKATPLSAVVLQALQAGGNQAGTSPNRPNESLQLLNLFHAAGSKDSMLASAGVMASPGHDTQSALQLINALQGAPNLFQTGDPSAALTSGSAASSTPTTVISQPLNHPGWGQALGERVQWMVGQHLQLANIKLNPPELGPLEVRIQMHHDQASVTFSALHGHVRDALEAAVPRLREMLGEHGINLADVNVAQQGFAGHSQQSTGDPSGSNGGFRATSFADGDGDALDSMRVQTNLGLLDVYA